MKLILASKSPRRVSILKEHGFIFDVIPSAYEEVIDKQLSVDDNVMNLAFNKAWDVFKDHRECCVLGSDTVVTIHNMILGKPIDNEDAFRTLKMLNGKTHYVKTGVAIICSEKTIKKVVTSSVTFKELSDEEIIEYLKTNEHVDKAGSYAIQGIASKFILSYEGDYDNIVGLPIKEFEIELREMIKL